MSETYGMETWISIITPDEMLEVIKADCTKALVLRAADEGFVVAENTINQRFQTSFTKEGEQFIQLFTWGTVQELMVEVEGILGV